MQIDQMTTNIPPPSDIKWDATPTATQAPPDIKWDDAPAPTASPAAPPLDIKWDDPAPAVQPVATPPAAIATSSAAQGVPAAQGHINLDESGKGIPTTPPPAPAATTSPSLTSQTSTPMKVDTSLFPPAPPIGTTADFAPDTAPPIDEQAQRQMYKTDQSIDKMGYAVTPENNSLPPAIRPLYEGYKNAQRDYGVASNHPDAKVREASAQNVLRAAKLLESQTELDRMTDHTGEKLPPPEDAYAHLQNVPTEKNRKKFADSLVSSVYGPDPAKGLAERDADLRAARNSSGEVFMPDLRTPSPSDVEGRQSLDRYGNPISAQSEIAARMVVEKGGWDKMNDADKKKFYNLMDVGTGVQSTLGQPQQDDRSSLPLDAAMEHAANAIFPDLTEDPIQKRISEQRLGDLAEKNPAASTGGAIAGGVLNPLYRVGGAAVGKVLKPILGETMGGLSALASGSIKTIAKTAAQSAFENATFGGGMSLAQQVAEGHIDLPKAIDDAATQGAEGALFHFSVGAGMEGLHKLSSIRDAIPSNERPKFDAALYDAIRKQRLASAHEGGQQLQQGLKDAVAKGPAPTETPAAAPAEQVAPKAVDEANYATVDPNSPNVKRIVRPAGGWGEQPTQTPPAAAPLADKTAEAPPPPAAGETTPQTAPPASPQPGSGDAAPNSTVAAEKPKTLYQETSPARARDLLASDRTDSNLGQSEKRYFANSKDMALGQGDNKGVHLEFEPNFKHDADTSKPGAPIAAASGQGEFTSSAPAKELRDNLRAVTVTPEIAKAMNDPLSVHAGLGRQLKRLEATGWTRTETPDGVRFEKGAGKAEAGAASLPANGAENLKNPGNGLPNNDGSGPKNEGAGNHPRANPTQEDTRPLANEGGEDKTGGNSAQVKEKEVVDPRSVEKHKSENTDTTPKGQPKSAPPPNKEMGELGVGDKMPLAGWKPADHPTVTDVRVDADGNRQYQVKFSKGSPQWMTATKRVMDADLGDKANLNVDPGATGIGKGSIGAAEDARALAQTKAREDAASSRSPSLLKHTMDAVANLSNIPRNWLRNFRERFNFLAQKYGIDGQSLAQPLGEYVGARKYADRAASVASGEVLKGLSSDEKSQFYALGMDGRRQVENMGVARQFADALIPQKKGGVPNKLASQLSGANSSGPNQAVLDAVFKALEHPDSFDRDNFAAELTGHLLNIDPNLITGWADLVAKRPEFSPEAMAGEEARRAGELMKLDDKSRSDILANKNIQGAMKRWKGDVEPTIMALRKDNKMPVDPNWDKVPLALNFAVDRGDRAYSPNIGVKTRDPFTFQGEGRQKVIDPQEALNKIISNHITKDKENGLLDALKSSKLSAPDDFVHLADNGKNKGRTVAMIGGEEVPVAKYDVARDPSKPDERWIPADIKKELDTLNNVQRPDTRGIGSFLLGMKLKGVAAIHAFNALSKTSQELAAKGVPRIENFAPWIGARAGTAIRGARDAFSPVGELHQLLLNNLGASGTRGFNTTHLEGKPTGLKDWAVKAYGIDHDALFAPKIGAENVMRGQLLNSYLSSQLGDKYGNIREAVRSKNMTPLEASRQISKMTGPATYQGAQRFVNDTLGWLDRDIRGEGMNKTQNLLTFIGVEASGLPGNIRRLLTANVDADGVGRLIKDGDLKTAGLRAASGILAGPVGMYAFANLVNLATSGRLMKDNDDGHKLDVHLGGGWYLGLDSMIQQAARLTGLKDWANGKSSTPTKYAANVAGHAASELTSIINPVYMSATNTLQSLYESLSGNKAHFSFNTGRPYSTTLGSNIPVPYLTNTVQNLLSGKSVGEGLAKDATSDLLGQSLTKVQNPGQTPTQTFIKDHKFHPSNTADLSPDDKAKRDFMYKLADQYRADKDPSIISDARNSGKITSAEAKEVFNRGKMTKLEYEAHGLSRELFFQAYDKASPAEKEELSSMARSKIDHDKHLTRDEKFALKDKYGF